MSTNLISRSEKKKEKSILEAIKNSMTAFIIKNPSQDEIFLQNVVRASQDMRDAENYFENVTDPELVDHAIYRMEAARSKYTYLIKQAKKKGLRVSIQENNMHIY